jgi:choline dehydrogenase-like flavoprotein
MMGCFEERVNAWEGANFSYCCPAFRKDGFVIEAVGAPTEMLAVRVTGLGLAHKNLMAKLGHLAMWGALIQAKSTGRVRALRNSWTPLITYSLSRRDAYLFQVSMKAVADLYFAAGAKFVTPGINKVPSYLHHPRDGRYILEANLKANDFNIIGNHPAGTCRMSENKKRAVVDSHGETHGLKNLFIADGSILPDAPGVNPQETIMALAAHTAAYIGQVI